MTTQTRIDPQAFIDMLFDIDEIAAVRIADKWGEFDNVTNEQYNAAWSIVERQTSFPTCPHCLWPIVEESGHQDCTNIFGNDAEDEQPEDDSDDTPSFQEVYVRAYRHFGSHEMADEATRMYPGDFI